MGAKKRNSSSIQIELIIHERKSKKVVVPCRVDNSNWESVFTTEAINTDSEWIPNLEAKGLLDEQGFFSTDILKMLQRYEHIEFTRPKK
jgi:hypothetical protein